MTEGARCSKKLRAENERILFFFSSQNEKGKESKGSVAEDGTKHSKNNFVDFLRNRARTGCRKWTVIASTIPS